MRILISIFLGLCASVPAKPKIVGGQEAGAHSMPYTVWFGFCGGTILSSRWIISAAHCFYGYNTPEYLQIGVHDIYHSGKSYKVESVQVHSGYNDAQITNDFALIYLAENIHFDETAGIAYLPAADHAPQSDPGSTCHVAGWGTLSYGGESPNTLQYVNLDIFENEICQNSFPFWFDESSQFCAGHLDGNVDSCQGDSGGPLICEIGGKPVLTGIVSWGYGCGEKGYPGVYSKVSSAINWIKSFNVDASFVTDPIALPVTTTSQPITTFSSVSTTFPTEIPTDYPGILFGPIRRAIEYSPVALPISEEELFYFLSKIDYFETILGSTATISVDGKFVTGENCGKESVAENSRWKKVHRVIKKRVKNWNQLLESGEFYGKKFCKNFRSMMGRILQYSRNTGYKCEMNGHSGPFDQSKSGDENSVKMELLEFAERFLQEFWCLGHSVNYY